MKTKQVIALFNTARYYLKPKQKINIKNKVFTMISEDESLEDESLEDESLGESIFNIDKYKLASTLHVFTQLVNLCQFPHDATVLMKDIEADIDDLFSDVEANLTHVTEQLMLLHFSVIVCIDWNAPKQSITKQIQAAKEYAKKALFNNKTSN